MSRSVMGAFFKAAHIIRKLPTKFASPRTPNDRGCNRCSTESNVRAAIITYCATTKRKKIVSLFFPAAVGGCMNLLISQIVASVTTAVAATIMSRNDLSIRFCAFTAGITVEDRRFTLTTQIGIPTLMLTTRSMSVMVILRQLPSWTGSAKAQEEQHLQCFGSCGQPF